MSGVATLFAIVILVTMLIVLFNPDYPDDMD